MQNKLAGIRYFILPLFILMLFTAAAQTNNGSLSVSITATDGKPVVAATVQIKQLRKTTLTGEDGKALFSDIPAGNYAVEVSFVGYETFFKTATVKAGQTTDISLALQAAGQQLAEVRVTGVNQAQKIREGGFDVSAIETKKYANTTADLNQILNRSTGVKIRETGGLGSDFNFSLNGLSGNQIKFFIDGIPMEVFGSSLSLNNIPVNLVERMDVYKGVVPVSLGADALGGAVNVVTSQKVNRFLDASYSYGSFNTHRASLAGQYRNDKTGFTVRAGGYYNYSANNYMMRDVEVVENYQFVKGDYRRFHDQYRSYMGQVEAGFTNKKWADVFMLGLLHSNQYKEYQTTATQDFVLGSLHARDKFLLPTLRYKKDDFLVKDLSVNFFSSYGKDNNTVVDTSRNIYHWNGIYTTSGVGELGYNRTIFHYDNRFLLNRINLTYKLDENNALNFNYTSTMVRRKASEELGFATNLFDKPNKIFKNVAGVALETNAFNKRVTTNVFGKYYRFKAAVRNAVNYSGTEIKKTDTAQTYNYLGHGIATRVKLLPSLGLKASYEHSYRMPEADEIFGDGALVLSNNKLKPEESDNFNVGAYFTKTINRHSFSVEGGFFYRSAKDFIYTVQAGRFSFNDNKGKVLINGVEAEIKYSYADLVSLVANISNQNAANNARYIPGTAAKDVTYLNRIPNQPWLFGNGELSIGKNDVWSKESRLQFTWFTQYIRSFYLTWANLGSANTKNIIPTQLIHNAVLSYSFKASTYNLSLESQNITNELAFDNFRLQKPGRSFSAKFRYFFSR